MPDVFIKLYTHIYMAILCTYAISLLNSKYKVDSNSLATTFLYDKAAIVVTRTALTHAS